MTANEYNKLNELLSEFSEVNAALERAESSIKTVQLTAARELLPEHAQLKVRLTDLETAIRKLTDAHDAELFTGDARTHKTPFGEIAYRKSAELEFDDAEKVLLKIKLVAGDEEARALVRGESPRFTLEALIRQREEPNLRALEGMDDATLALFGVTRVHKDNFKVKPFAMKSDKPGRKEKVAA